MTQPINERRVMLSCAIDNPPDLHRQCIERYEQYTAGECVKIITCTCPCHAPRRSG